VPFHIGSAGLITRGEPVEFKYGENRKKNGPKWLQGVKQDDWVATNRKAAWWYVAFDMQEQCHVIQVDGSNEQMQVKEVRHPQVATASDDDESSHYTKLRKLGDGSDIIVIQGYFEGAVGEGGEWREVEWTLHNDPEQNQELQHLASTLAQVLLADKEVQVPTGRMRRDAASATAPAAKTSDFSQRIPPIGAMRNELYDPEQLCVACSYLLCASSLPLASTSGRPHSSGASSKTGPRLTGRAGTQLVTSTARFCEVSEVASLSAGFRSS